MHHVTAGFPKITVRPTDQRLISHAGLQVTTSFTNALGLRDLCEAHLGGFVPSLAWYRTGNIVGPLAVMLAGGGEFVSDLDMLRESPGAFGQIASNATVSRFFDQTTKAPEQFTAGFAAMTRQVRSRVWDSAGDRNPALWASARNPIILDIDATLVAAHSDKEGATGDYKGGYGFSPVVISMDYHGLTGPDTCDGSGEVLAIPLREGKAPANKAADNIIALDLALAQLPEEFYDERGVLIGEKILIRTDSAGAPREFLDYVDALGIQFSVSYPVPPVKGTLLEGFNDKTLWQPALTQTGAEREGAWVVNATEVLGLTDYPEGTQLYLRAEPLHPGAKATLLDMDGNRITAFLTNASRWDGPELDVRHRGRGRCENRIKTLKNTGLAKLPFKDFAANQAWANIAMLAMNLTSWIQLAVLPHDHPAARWDIKRWRYRVFAIVGKIITRARRNYLLLPTSAPEIGTVTLILDRIEELRSRLRPVIPLVT